MAYTMKDMKVIRLPFMPVMGFKVTWVLQPRSRLRELQGLSLKVSLRRRERQYPSAALG